MTFKSGDLVVLKSGGPTMTVDTVNTDIFDDDKITGVLCVWFVDDKFERARFDHRAIEPAGLQGGVPKNPEPPAEEAAGDYKNVLDDMVSAMNIPAEDGGDAPGRRDASSVAGVTMAVTKRKRGARTTQKTLGPH